MRPIYRVWLWWNKLWIRGDEFHPSLSYDAIMASEMTVEERRKYETDLIRRREIAHHRDLARLDRR